MTTNLCSARKVNACAERGSKYWRFSTTSTCSLKRRRREEYQIFPRKSAKKRRNTQNARVQQKPSRTSKSYDRAKRKQKLLKRDENSQKRETYRKSQAAKERGNFPTCQALNRLDRQCKSKALDQSDFCKIHQFHDSTSGQVQCLGINKRFKQCIKSIPIDEKYCKYHMNKKQS